MSSKRASSRRLWNSRLRLFRFEDRIVPAFSEFIDPNPAVGNQFGASVIALSTGNVVVTSPFDDFGGTDAGAVYLFNGATGALISTLRGSHANDNVGSGGVTALTNGNYVVVSTLWDDGVNSNVGAVTWGNGDTGIAGIVGVTNSLVGVVGDDSVGSGGVIALSNGNYVVVSAGWDNGAATNAGAVTWGNGITGVTGAVGISNSLYGSDTANGIGGGGVTALSNGNYVVVSAGWDNGAAINVGAVTWGNGAVGIFGAVNAANSLVGSKSNDSIGNSGVVGLSAVTLLSNGNYVVSSPNWDNGAATEAGAVTWGSATAGVSGLVSAANSLVGSKSNDKIGLPGLTGVTALSNGNYVVACPTWDNGAITNAGAAAWGNGTVGVSGVISAANSLVGTTADDAVGLGGVTALTNGNYVVRSHIWDNGATTNVGAVTWGSGAAGVVGAVSSANSLVGSKAFDTIGEIGVSPGFNGVLALPNGNYVVASYAWDNGAATDAGAVTWGSGTAGVKGAVSTLNSLVGSKTNDYVGLNGTLALSNGNYVVISGAWANGTITFAGAVTWRSGIASAPAVVSSANSLVGGKTEDYVGTDGSVSNGTVTALSNGNYVVRSSRWDNGAAGDAGAATWGNGTIGVSGVVGTGNSLVGSKANDNVGNNGVVPLTNGNYVVLSRLWDNVAVVDAGAATWGNGTIGISGPVSAVNSLVGSTASDSVGFGKLLMLANGDYVVVSTNWDNGAVTDAGAATWGSGTIGISGVVSAANSLVGSTASDKVGLSAAVPIALSNGNYLVASPSWDNGAFADAGAVSFGNGSTGVVGVIDSTNSAIGSAASTSLQSPPTLDLVNGTFFGRFKFEGGGRVRVGSLTTGFIGGSLSARLIGNDLSIADVDGTGKANNLALSFDGANYIITDTTEKFWTAPEGGVLSNGNKTLTIPASAFSGKIIVNGEGGSDTLTVDWSNKAITKNIDFNGGTGASDKLVVSGGTFTNTHVNHTNANDGNIVVDSSVTMSFTGLEPVDIRANTIDYITFKLPSTPSDAVLEDFGTSGDGFSQLRSANGTFETTQFSNPQIGMKIVQGHAADSVTLNSLPDFNRSLDVGDSVLPPTMLTVAGTVALTGAGSMSLYALTSINLTSGTGNLSASGSGVIGLVSYGDVSIGAGSKVSTVNAPVTLYVDYDGNGAGTLTLANGSSIVCSGSSVAVTAADMDIQGTISAATTASLVASGIGRPIEVVGSAVGSLNLSAAELASVSGSLFIGDGFSGPVTLSNDLARSTPVSLMSGHSVNLAANLTSSSSITLNSVGPIIQTVGTVNAGSTLNVGATTATFTTLGNKAASLVVNINTICVVNGSFDSTGFVQVEGTLSGTGSVGAVSAINFGTLAPGTLPGKLTTAGVVLNPNTTFHVDLNGVNAGTDYDQVVVDGTLALGNAKLQGSLGFTPTTGQEFKIIDKVSGSATSTTFGGYANGDTVTIGGRGFTINYVGGDGNDVTLTTLPLAPTATVTFGDGSNQRSMVKQIVVNFSEFVNFTGASAFTLYRSGTGLPNNNVILNASPPFGTASAVTITFSGTLTTNGSLNDGFYDFTIDSDQVTGIGGKLDGGAGSGTDHVVIGNTTNKYFRLFGDGNGDGVTNLTDFAAFRGAFNLGANNIYDFGEGDNNVGLSDFAAFRTRFNLTP